MKTCTKCLKSLPFDRFYKKKGCKDGMRAQCIDCVLEKSRERYKSVLSSDESFMARNRERGLEWYYANIDHNRARIAANHRSERDRCIAHYGNVCACCGEHRYEFLCIDHIDGGGEQHRKSGISKICRWLIRNNFPSGFRVLCANCNSALGHYGFCPHHPNESSPKKTSRNQLPKA